MRQFKYTINGNDYNVTVKKIEETTAEVEVNGVPYKVSMDKPTKAIANKRPVQALTSTTITSTPLPVIKRQVNTTTSGGSVQAPLPGVIISIDCNIGDAVKKGQKLLTLEAMKMDNTIPADRDGIVSEIKVKMGDSILEGADLIIIQ